MLQTEMEKRLVREKMIARQELIHAKAPQALRMQSTNRLLHYPSCFAQFAAMFWSFFRQFRLISRLRYALKCPSLSTPDRLGLNLLLSRLLFDGRNYTNITINWITS